jgi:hypothetical protein
VRRIEWPSCQAESQTPYPPQSHREVVSETRGVTLRARDPRDVLALRTTSRGATRRVDGDLIRSGVAVAS